MSMDLPLHETIADQLRKGHISRCDADGVDQPHIDGEDPVPGLPESRPGRNATKADWVGWAVAQGADVEEASLATKADLIDLYGSDSPKPDEQ
jgi:hypothetical protein